MSLDSDNWNYTRDSEAAKVDAWQIVQDAARLHECLPSDLIGPCRYGRYVAARHLAMYEIARRMPWMSYPQIGKYFGGRDHSTVMSAVAKFGLPARFHRQRFISRHDFISKVRAVDTLFFGLGAALGVQCSKGEQNETT